MKFIFPWQLVKVYNETRWVDIDEDDHIILLHKFAKAHLMDGVTFTQARDYLEKKGIKVNDPDVSAAIDRTFGEVFMHSGHFAHGIRKDHTKYHMTNESYYRLLEYQNYMGSLVASKKSEFLAIVAVLLTFLALIAQMLPVGGDLAKWRIEAKNGEIDRIANELQIKEYYKNHPDETYKPIFR